MTELDISALLLVLNGLAVAVHGIFVAVSVKLYSEMVKWKVLSQ